MNTRNWYRWMILGGLLLAVIFVPLPAGASAPVSRVLQIDARQFEYNPAILRVNPGDTVTIELKAADVVHGLSIDGYGLETTAEPGQTARISFVADHQGTYRFHCTVTCGNMHPFMTGKLVVGQDTFLPRAIGIIGLALLAGAWKSKA